MSEKRRRGTSGLGKKLLVWGGWGVVVLLLGGNLLMAYLNADKTTGEPQSSITPAHLQTALFWLPISACLVMSVLGLFWTSRAYAQTERNSLLWARRGYLFSILGAVVLSMATYDAELFAREWLAGLASLLFSGQTVLFAMLGFREYRRAETGEGSRHTRSRRDKPGAATSAAAGDATAASPDSAQ